MGTQTPLLRSALISRPVAVSKGAQTLSRVAALGLLADVVLSDRTQQGNEYAKTSEDVDDREDPRSIAGRVEVSVANGGQGHDREVEGLDEAPVLEAPVEDRPREHQRAGDERQRPRLGITPDGDDRPRKSSERKEE